MELVTYTDSDLPLTEALECDPEVMKELGGPIAKDAIPETHRRRIDAVAQGGWWFKIVPEASGPAAGTIGIWRSEWRGREIHEAGWMVLPSFQGRASPARPWTACWLWGAPIPASNRSMPSRGYRTRPRTRSAASLEIAPLRRWRAEPRGLS